MWLDRFRRLSPRQADIETEPPRAVRFKLDLPISFATGGELREGKCLNVSDSGLFAKFDKVPELWDVGLLLLEAGEHYLSINARVARIEGMDAGFAFLIKTDNDRAAIKILVHSVLEFPLLPVDPA